MTSILGTLKVIFEGDTSKLNSSIDEAEKKSGGLTSSLSSMAKQAASVAVGVGITQLPGFLTSAASAAAEEEAATLRLNNTLENLVDRGGSAGRSVEELMSAMDGAISSGQDLAFSDDDVRNSMQFLINATDDYDEAARRQALAMDLARGAGIPLEQATRLLGRTSEENVNTFRKLGIEMAEGASEADVLAAVSERYAGQAESFADSTAGQFAQSQIAMAELKESIGLALLPVMTLLGTLLTTVIIPAIEMGLMPALNLLSVAIGFVIDNAEPLAPLLIAVATAAGIILIPVLISVIAATWLYVAALIAQAIAFIAANAGLILLALAIAAVVGGIIWLVQNWDKVKPAFEATIDWITGTMYPKMKEYLYEKPKEIVQNIIDFVTDNWLDILLGPIGMLDWLDNKFDLGIKDFLFEKPKEIVTDIIDWFDNNFNKLQDAPGAFLDYLKGDFISDYIYWFHDQPIEWINKMKDGVITGVSNMISGVAGLAGAAWDAMYGVGTQIMEGLKSALSSTGGFAGDIASAVLEATKGVINSAIDSLNSMIEFSFDTHIPGVGTVHINPPDIGHLASGTDFWHGGLAIVGERGPELVNLPRGTGVLSADKTASVLQGATVNIYARDEAEGRASISGIGFGLHHELVMRGLA